VVGKGRPKTRIFTPMWAASSNTIPVIIWILISLGIGRIMAGVQRRRADKKFQSRQDYYDQVLSRYNPYFKSLLPDGRQRFIRRVLNFIESKKFEYIDLEAEASIPVLVSAAAIQLTYGLEHYRLDYFKTIYIIKDRYTYGLSSTPYEGHVNEEGIYLSWAHFMREFSDYTDGQNVGLHEMAHALTYVNFTAHQGRDRNFHDTFVNFSAVARPVFERVQAGEINLLNPYAATNYQEFWAVCVEAFFERSSDFKSQLPELYSALCTLLNQDPLTTEKFLTIPAA